MPSRPVTLPPPPAQSDSSPRRHLTTTTPPDRSPTLPWFLSMFLRSCFSPVLSGDSATFICSSSAPMRLYKGTKLTQRRTVNLHTVCMRVHTVRPQTDFPAFASDHKARYPKTKYQYPKVKIPVSLNIESHCLIDLNGCHQVFFFLISLFAVPEEKWRDIAILGPIFEKSF